MVVSPEQHLLEGQWEGMKRSGAHLPKILLLSPTFFLMTNLPIVCSATAIAFALALTSFAACSALCFSFSMLLYST